jgi:(2S)-methylsuccinyl-CoA dehydrogenase
MTGAAGRNADDGLPHRTAAAAAAVDDLVQRATPRLKSRLSPGGSPDPALAEREQHAVHGLAWLATYAETLRALSLYAARLAELGRLSEMEGLLLTAVFSEYLQQIVGGIPMNQGEFVRPRDLYLAAADLDRLSNAAADFLDRRDLPALRARIVALMGEGRFGDCGLDATLDSMRAEMRRFADERIAPHAHAWHLSNSYVPLELISELAELGVFALTLPESYGGMGMGKVAMCVVSEELSRGWIAVGSIGTRAEIACELILNDGTPEQRQKWLPGIASGRLLPTAVFTEPDTGSDLSSIKTRAVRRHDSYFVTGSKTWITHPVRADLMTLLVRTDATAPGHKGLSMFIAEKPRGTESDPFPVKGLAGSEIEVLGYRGLKEFELSFDDFEIPAFGLLGGSEGSGFRQLMQTFESARIQTAARAIGVAQNALELGLDYATQRRQFGKAIVGFPRISDKLAMMAMEIMAARQLAYYAAREKDQGRRCDLQAGMAKLLAARVAWAAADNALQIHGGNGFALEFPISRVLCDARILNIFEGAAEIQAQVIARRLLEGGN